ncbi:MAG: Homoserine O-acetyltransferase, partial [uncultured Rubrobacteraceae bacterium]
ARREGPVLPAGGRRVHGEAHDERGAARHPGRL